MAFSQTQRAEIDPSGRGKVYGNLTLSGVTTGAFSVPFAQVLHVNFCSNVSATPITYAATAYNVSLTGASGDAATYEVYGA